MYSAKKKKILRGLFAYVDNELQGSKDEKCN
jgi:hypothetical protein